MWKAAAATVAVLAAILLLTTLQNGEPGLDPSLQLSLERSRNAVRQNQPPGPPALDCVARRASGRTVETLYRVWVDERRDLTTQAERDQAEADVSRLIGACGGDAAALETQAHARGVELDRAAAEAMLRAGR